MPIATKCIPHTFLLILISYSTTLAQPPAYPDSAYLIQDSVNIPLKDGGYSSAVIVRKKTNTSPLPVILFYTTYFQGPNDANFAKRSADRDYVGVLAYPRGIRSDLRQYKPFENDAKYIYAIIDWISKQPWCNGSVGMMGGSYTGFAQWAAVRNIHPALKTIVPQVAVMPGFDFPMENGVPLPNILSWSHDNIYKHPPLPRDLFFTYFNNGLAFNQLDSIAGYTNPIFQNWLSHPTYDAYWRSMAPSPEEYARINIPVLTTTGYYDGSQISALQYFKLHHRYNRNVNHYLVIGPYDHFGGQRRASKNLMGYTIDSVADVSMQTLAYDWLDHILKGKPKPALLKDKVNYQVMGTNQWKHSPSLQAMNNDTLTFYLDRNTLTPIKPKNSGFMKQRVDFSDRENQNNYFTPSIIFDSLDSSNGLVFTTAPFKEAFEINGSFTGNLSVTINKKDMDVSLALYEIMPDGKYFFLTRYVGRASQAMDNTKRQLLKPGTITSISFDNTRFVSREISKGSKLAILLNVNKHPFEVINYGSGKAVSTENIKDSGAPLVIQWNNNSYIQIPSWKTEQG